MGAFTSVLMAAGIGLQVYGQYKEGQDAYATGQYNAALYKQQADIIDVKKKLSKHDWARTIDQLEGKVTSAVASSGYDLKGSFLTVMADRLTEAQLDKQTELYNLEVAKGQSLSAADEATREGSAARTASLFKAGGTLLTEGNEWYGKYGPETTTPGKA
jgi:hypothetical protein